MARRKIKGRFCEKTLGSKSSFDRRSFRWKKSGKAFILIGCPKGKFKNGRCRTGTKAYKLLSKSKSCPAGRRITKG